MKILDKKGNHSAPSDAKKSSHCEGADSMEANEVILLNMSFGLNLTGLLQYFFQKYMSMTSAIVTRFQFPHWRSEQLSMKEFIYFFLFGSSYLILLLFFRKKVTKWYIPLREKLVCPMQRARPPIPTGRDGQTASAPGWLRRHRLRPYLGAWLLRKITT
ncbi:MAG: hypothetical protein D6730_16225 [Bacteroidetes bacterium]|nr:MAG: hypothetical protein D6730_16225 [Bacteroidota bacterium]